MRIAAAALVLVATSLVGCDGGGQHAATPAPVGSAAPTSPIVATATVAGRPAPVAGPSGKRPRPCATRPDYAAGAARDVVFRTARVGWVVVAHRVLSTVDGGQRWTTAYRATGRQNLWSVDFVDQRHGWVVASNGLLRTTDGGRRWRLLAATCPHLQIVDFATPRLGYAVASRDTPRNGATTQGELLRTRDGGTHWRRVRTPAQVQSVCVADRQNVWLGANGNVYWAHDSQSRWRLIVRHKDYGSARYPPVANVHCTSGSAAWAVVFCQCGAASQSPHVGYHLTRHGGTPIFAEQYFPHPGVRVRHESPGSYSGPFAVVNRRDAVFFDVCPACEHSVKGSHGRRVLTSGEYAAIARDHGRRLIRPGRMSAITAAAAAYFPTRDEGWLLGTRSIRLAHQTRARSTTLLLHTTDGGRTWQVGLRL